MSAKKRRLSSSLTNDGSLLASPFTNSFVESMMSNDENTEDEEPLSFVQSLRMKMDKIEQESAERQKAIADLPHMQKLKKKAKRRQMQNILQEMAGQKDSRKIKRSRKRKRLNEQASKFLVMTGIEKSTKETLLAIVEQLGGYVIRREVDLCTTHVISAGKQRTVNVLKAILCGCWILSVEWVLKSLERGFWLEEEPFELVEDFPSAKSMRIERNLSLLPYRCQLLADIGPIFVPPNTSPPSCDIVKLIELSGGRVCGTARRAAMCIGKISSKTNSVEVSEKWLLDSITQQTVLPLDSYQEVTSP